MADQQLGRPSLGGTASWRFKKSRRWILWFSDHNRAPDISVAVRSQVRGGGTKAIHAPTVGPIIVSPLTRDLDGLTSIMQAIPTSVSLHLRLHFELFGLPSYEAVGHSPAPLVADGQHTTVESLKPKGIFATIFGPVIFRNIVTIADLRWFSLVQIYLCVGFFRSKISCHHHAWKGGSL